MVLKSLFVAMLLAVPAVPQSVPAAATLTIESHTEAEGMVKVDGQWYCALPNHKTCKVSSIQPGTHKFEFIFIDVDAPGRAYPIETSGTFTAGQHRNMDVDTDGATWK
jgi:hypothetical protein